MSTQTEWQDSINLACPYGFVLTPQSEAEGIANTTGWREVHFKDYSVFLHPLTSHTIIANAMGEDVAILIGEAFCCSGQGDVSDKIRALAEQGDWNSFDEVSGRFALIVEVEGAPLVLQDPFGSRTVYYYRGNSTCISSHTALIAKLLNLKISNSAREFMKLSEYRQRGTGYLPGKLTMYTDVKCLLPNHYLDLKSKKPNRFWPRSGRTEKTLEQFLADCNTYFRAYASHLKETGRTCLLGLTGGVDTRAVIAGLMGQGMRPKLVTWTGGRLPENEVGTVMNMIKHLKMPHDYIPPSISSETPELKALLSATNLATGYCRGQSRLSLSMTQVTGPDFVFVRGYGGEILRGFHNRHMHGRKSQVDRSDLVELFYNLYKTRRVEKPCKQFENFARAAFQELVEEDYSNYELFDYDILDLFYWEQRMGVWGANMHNEMDPVVYSQTGLNSRLLYDSAFGLTPDERLGSKLMLDITALSDPEFARMGVVS